MDIIYVAVNGEYEDTGNTYVGTDLKVAVQKWLDNREVPESIELWKDGKIIGSYGSNNSNVMDKKHYSVDEIVADVIRYKDGIL